MEKSAKRRYNKKSGNLSDQEGPNSPIKYFDGPEKPSRPGTSTIWGRVTDYGEDCNPIQNALITFCKQGGDTPLYQSRTDSDGSYEICNVAEGTYDVYCSAFGLKVSEKNVMPKSGCGCEVDFQLECRLSIKFLRYADNCEDLNECSHAQVGDLMLLRAQSGVESTILAYKWHLPAGTSSASKSGREITVKMDSPGDNAYAVTAIDQDGADGAPGAALTAGEQYTIFDTSVQMVAGNLDMRMQRTASAPTPDQALWVAIRNRTRAISYAAYHDFINRVLGGSNGRSDAENLLVSELEELNAQVHGVGAYQVLKTATEAFLLLECGVRIPDEKFFVKDEESARLGGNLTFTEVKTKLENYLGGKLNQLPYITRVIRAAFPGLESGSEFSDRVLMSRAPCMLELVWSYWHEEGMLVQSINAISRRFQNIRGPGDRDPLAHLEIDPLRPINNLIWGYLQDEQHRLSITRRSYEYDHHYGIALHGKAIPQARSADRRSKFLEAFHNLLYKTSVFFKEDNDTTVIADGFPLLNALKEVHMLLAQGAHNQFGDLPWTARVEMLIQQWILGRSEIREFLQSRVMVPYKEGWMPQVDTMKTMQGWSDVTVSHFHDLGTFGEQLLLAVRLGDWIGVNNEDSAKNFARYWRPEIQGYLHSYRAVTGIDLTNPDTIDSIMPGFHLQKRLALQQRTR